MTGACTKTSKKSKCLKGGLKHPKEEKNKMSVLRFLEMGGEYDDSTVHPSSSILQNTTLSRNNQHWRNLNMSMSRAMMIMLLLLTPLEDVMPCENSSTCRSNAAGQEFHKKMIG